MGKGRFIYNDYDADADLTLLTASSLRVGQVGLAIKTGTGAAVGLAGGAYSGAVDRHYRVQIDSIAGGAEVGQATFAWRDGSVVGWNASGVATAAAATALNNGVTFAFTTGAGADFVVGDYWDFTATAFFGLRQLLDRDRDTMLQTGALAAPEWIRRDLGSAKEITACVIDDHNLTSAATIALKASDDPAETWVTPAYTFPGGIPRVAGTIVAYLDQTYRYWRLEVTDAGNPDGHIEIGNWFLGTYFEPTGNYDRGWGQDRVAVETIVKTDAGARRHLIGSVADEYTLQYRLLPQADRDGLLALEAAVHDVTNLRSRPFWFHRDAAVAGGIALVTLPARVRVTSPYLDRYEVDLTLSGLPRTGR